MIINIDIDEQELKDKILRGIDSEEAIDDAVESCQEDLKLAVENTIQKTEAYKNARASTSDGKIKEAIKKMTEEFVTQKLQNEIRTYVTLESQLPRIVKVQVQEFLKDYVEEEIEKQVRKVYEIEINVNRKHKKEGAN